MTICIGEQIDPSGLLCAYIPCCNKAQAQACGQSFEKDITPVQKIAG